MKYFSTKNKTVPFSFEDAVLKGLPQDNGLFVPEYLPQLDADFLSQLSRYSFQEIGMEIARHFVGNEIETSILNEIINEVLSFPARLVHVEENIYSLELYHGPTLAFKDFGARFMARIMHHFNKNKNKKLRILVATSGDTGGAVASGFFGLSGIEVVILYPKGRVSHYQKKQLTTFGNNIQAIEVDGSFDDCQRMVKQAFLDDEINKVCSLSSANSINISRLIPQSFYYFEAAKQLSLDKNKSLYFSVPSGNLGNITAGLYAKKMGLRIDKFISANNANDFFSNYLISENPIFKDSVITLSNAMDVGAPSNFYRILDLYGSTWNNIVKEINPYVLSDEKTIATITKCYEDNKYILDPHGAIAYSSLKSYLKYNNNLVGVFLETAHPAKFYEELERRVSFKIPIPNELNQLNELKEVYTELPAEFESFKDYLLNTK